MFKTQTVYKRTVLYCVCWQTKRDVEQHKILYRTHIMRVITSLSTLEAPEREREREGERENCQTIYYIQAPVLVSFFTDTSV